MKGFFDETIDEIIGHIDTQITSETKAILIPGGFGKCLHFIKRMRDTYAPRGIKVVDSFRD